MNRFTTSNIPCMRMALSCVFKNLGQQDMLHPEETEIQTLLRMIIYSTVILSEQKEKGIRTPILGSRNVLSNNHNHPHCTLSSPKLHLSHTKATSLFARQGRRQNWLIQHPLPLPLQHIRYTSGIINATHTWVPQARAHSPVCCQNWCECCRSLCFGCERLVRAPLPAVPDVELAAPTTQLCSAWQLHLCLPTSSALSQPLHSLEHF